MEEPGFQESWERSKTETIINHGCAILLGILFTIAFIGACWGVGMWVEQMRW